MSKRKRFNGHSLAAPLGKLTYDVELRFGGATYTIGQVYVGEGDSNAGVTRALAAILAQTADEMLAQLAGNE